MKHGREHSGAGTGNEEVAMRRFIYALTAAVVWSLCAASQPETVESHIVRAGMFKNGLAMVKRVIEVEGGGTYRIEDVPEAVHGTLWIESDAVVEARVSIEDVKVVEEADLP